MIIDVKNPTYKYKKPVEFCQEKYYDSKTLAEAILDNWDAAITTFKGGNWEKFWSDYADVPGLAATVNERKFSEVFHAMWSYERDANPDVLFSKIVHIIEPAMKEIPCFIGSLEEIKLWKAEDFKAYFNYRIPSKSDFLGKEILEKDCLPEPGSAFDEEEESILYACNMLREEVFSEFGYTNVEKPFLDMLSGKKSGKEWDKFDFKAVYQRIAEGFYERDIFCYHGKEYASMEEFAKVWEKKIDTWSMKQWDTFIEEIFLEENGRTGFLQWIKKVCPQGNGLSADFRQWKVRFDRKPELREALPKPKEVSLEGYLKWGTQEEHDGILKECADKVENILIWKKSHSECSKVEDLENIYFWFYNLLQQVCETKGCPWEELELTRDLDQLMKFRKSWEIMVEQEYYDKRELLKAIRSHDVLSCLEHSFLNDFIYHGRKVDKKIFLPLLACAPVMESYREDCEKVWKLLEKWVQERTYDLEIIYRILIGIYEDIYLELFEVSASDEVVDYYFDFMNRIAVTLLGKNHLGVIIDDSIAKVKPIRRFLLDRIDKNAGSVRDDFALWDSKKAAKIIGGLRELSERRNVDYAEFHSQDAYKKWISVKSRVSQIEGQWRRNSDIVRAKSDEVTSYIDKNWCIRNLTEIKEGIGPILKELWQALEETKKNRRELEKQVVSANVRYDAVRKACKDYEDAWDKKREEEEEAARLEEIRKRKRKENIKRIRKVLATFFIIVAVGLSVIVGYNYKFKKNLKSYGLTTEMIEINDYLDENGVLTLPSEIKGNAYSEIGNLSLPESVNTLVIPEGVVSINATTRVVNGGEPVYLDGIGGMGLREIVIPDSLETIFGDNYWPYLEKIITYQDYSQFDITQLETLNQE